MSNNQIEVHVNKVEGGGVELIIKEPNEETRNAIVGTLNEYYAKYIDSDSKEKAEVDGDTITLKDIPEASSVSSLMSAVTVLQDVQIQNMNEYSRELRNAMTR